MHLLRARSPDVPTQDDPAYKQLVRPHAILQVTTQDLQAIISQENSPRAEIVKNLYTIKLAMFFF